MDFSSEMIHSLLPVFLVTTLGASATSLGIIEGAAEATAAFVKVFSGVMSDWLTRRKPLVVFGYGLAAVSKPLFPLAQSAAWVFVARTVDRIGKGLRGAPRDALLADATSPENRGAAYGLRQTLDTTGALLGPLAATLLMMALANNVRAVFWIATLPAVAAVVALVAGVRESERPHATRSRSLIPHWREIAELGSPYWYVVVLSTLFSLARFSEAFLILISTERGLPLAQSPLALAVMNTTYVLSAYPAGKLSDRIGRRGLLLIGLAVLALADLVLATTSGVATAFLGIGLWGLHMGLTQGLLPALVADTAPEHLRGSAFGLFHLTTGIALLASSALAGIVWEFAGPAYTFGLGIAFSVGTIAWMGLKPTRWPRLNEEEKTG